MPRYVCIYVCRCVCVHTMTYQFVRGTVEERDRAVDRRSGDSVWLLAVTYCVYFNMHRLYTCTYLYRWTYQFVGRAVEERDWAINWSGGDSVWLLAVIYCVYLSMHRQYCMYTCMCVYRCISRYVNVPVRKRNRRRRRLSGRLNAARFGLTVGSDTLCVFKYAQVVDVYVCL